MARPIKTPSSPDYRAKIGAVAEALFAERGFDGTSIREIAEQAGTTKALIYHYYDNKEALYQALLEEAVSGVVTQIEAIAADGTEPETQLRAVVQVFIDAYHDAPHRFQMVQRTIDDHHAVAAGAGRALVFTGAPCLAEYCDARRASGRPEAAAGPDGAVGYYRPRDSHPARPETRGPYGPATVRRAGADRLAGPGSGLIHR